MNVHPSAYDYLYRDKPLAPTTAEAFAPEALYEIKIDVNGDAVADIAYRMRFSSSMGRLQTATLRRIEGAQAAGRAPWRSPRRVPPPRAAHND